LLNFLQLSREEMIRILDPMDLFWLSQRIIESLDVGARPILVETSLNDELGFEHPEQEIEVHDGNGNAQPHQHGNARVGSSNLQSNTRAERESDEANRCNREARCEEIQRCPDVFDFADAVAVASGAFPDSAEIEAQSRQPHLRGCLRSTEDDLVVHRPAVERVRMAHQRSEARLHARIPLEKRFKRAFGARDQKALDFRNSPP
jgi:hypothetical protein